MFGRRKTKWKERDGKSGTVVPTSSQRNVSTSQHQAFCQGEVNSVYAVDAWCLEAVKVDGRSLGVSQVLNF